MEYLYIFRSYSKDSSLLKFGFTTDIWARFAQYKSSNPSIEIVYIAQLENALEIEQTFHKKHPAVSGNEWYEEYLLSVMMDYLNSVPHAEYIFGSKPDKISPCKKSNKFENMVIALQNKTVDADIAYTKYPFLEDAIDLLGFEQIHQMNYNQTNIKTKLLKQLYIPNNVHIKELLKPHINIGEFMSNPTIKTIIKNIYNTLNINKKVPATAIQDYYITKITKYDNVHGHRIIKEK